MNEHPDKGNGSCRVSVHTTPAQWAPIEADWRALQRNAARPDVAVTPEWLLAETERPDAEAPRVVTVHDGEALVGLAPLVQRRTTLDCRFGYRTLARFGLRMLDHCGIPLLARDDPDVHRQLLDGLSAAAGGCDAINLENVPVSSWMRRLLVEERAWPRGWRCVRYAPRSWHWLSRLDAGFEAYAAKFGGKTRQKLRGAERRLRAECGGDLALRRVTDPADVPAFAKDLGHLAARTWQGQRLGQFVQTAREDSVRLESWARRGWLCAYLLLARGQPIAFVVGRHADGIYYYDAIGHDAAWAGYSPGKVLLWLLIQDLCTRGDTRWLDFRHGDADYKRFFGTEGYEEESFYLVRRTWRNRVAFGCFAACNLGVLLARQAADSFGAARAIRRWRHAGDGAPRRDNL
jgi:hypothetical protein